MAESVKRQSAPAPDALACAAALDGAVGGAEWAIAAGDCLSVLPRLPSESVDLVFADPPYNLQLRNELLRPNMTRVDGVDDEWDKFESFRQYDDFCEKWLRECRRVLRPHGAIWVIGSYHNIFRVGRLMQDLGYWILNDVIWRKTNPMPNFRGVRFTNATETLIWAAKSSDSRKVFQHALMKAENGGKQMRNDDWCFPLCGGRERLRDGAGRKLHPTQKPEALLRRVILSSTRAGDLVLDPFVGGGTTLAAARKLGRRAIGIEREQKYIAAAAARAAQIRVCEAEIPRETPPPRRVPMLEILRRDLVRPGQKLYPLRGEGAAEVLQSGAIRCDGHEGSIHSVAAKIQNLSACNGWMFWRIKEGRRLVLLDRLRAVCRAEAAPV